MMIGTSTVNNSLVSDSGVTNKVTLYNCTYVPSSPFKLCPPFLLVQNIKTSGYRTKKSQ